MPFIGKQPQAGAYSKLDSITTSATATYNLTLDSGAYYPQSANHLLVSLNGVIQAPQDSFTVSGSQIIFDSALTNADVIDFIIALGDTLDIGVPSAGSVNTSQLANNAVTSAKLDTNIAVTGTFSSGGDAAIGGDLRIKGTEPDDAGRLLIRVSDTQVLFQGNESSAQTDKTFAFFGGNQGVDQIATLRNGGINFGSDTADANLLHDYEEGTWTGSVGAVYGFTPGASATFNGNYVKIGDQLTVNCSINFDTSETLALGDRFIIQGIPFITTGSVNGIGGGSFIQPGSFASGTHAVGTVATNSQSQDEAMCVVTKVNGTPPALNNTNVNIGITYKLTNTF